MEIFSKGAVVQTKDGGQKMTVVQQSADGRTTDCKWQDESNLWHEHCFPTDDLKQVN